MFTVCFFPEARRAQIHKYACMWSWFLAFFYEYRFHELQNATLNRALYVMTLMQRKNRYPIAVICDR